MMPYGYHIILQDCLIGSNEHPGLEASVWQPEILSDCQDFVISVLCVFSSFMKFPLKFDMLNLSSSYFISCKWS